MKNKSKLAKIKNQNKPNANIPDGWFLMCKNESTISIIKDLLGEKHDVEIWPELGVAEVIIGEKSSIDIEALRCDLGDDFSNDFLKEHEVKSLFYLCFKKEDFELAKPVLKELSDGVEGFICGDTDDFTPTI